MSSRLHAEIAGPSLVVGAVLFDLDGVVTDTAAAHTASWKQLFDEFLQARADRLGEPFTPFDEESDYRVWVDGKPREDGVVSFLASRNISLPFGRDDDGPDAETVCGLAKRKNGYYLAWLIGHRVRVFSGARRLLGQLRDSGVRVALFSASRNVEEVLRSAGVRELFDEVVDGNEAARLGLSGKPDPAMLLEAAARLGVEPSRTAVFEDSAAGVRAGRRGGFGLVVGVDRGGAGVGLREAGAHMVVHHLGEMRLGPANLLGMKTLSTLPLVEGQERDIRARLRHRRPVIFLDYDGTLTPIVEDYTKAFLSPGMRRIVAELGERAVVAIVSGRDVELLRRLVQLESVYYAGSHGFEIVGPAGWSERLEKGVAFLPALDRVERALRDRLADVPGHGVERKRFAISVHYRRVAHASVGQVEAIVNAVLAGEPKLRKTHGKMVFEVRPHLRWDKGRAVLWLLDRLGLDGEGVVPIYIGDDITDEDAFRALVGRGLSVVVLGEEDRATSADYAALDPDSVGRVLKLLSSVVAGEREA
jgi:alpha,alpha-trehalase